MSKALEILQKPHHKSKFNNVTMVVYKEEQIKEVIADIEAMKPKTCDTCKKVKSCLFHKVATDPMPTINEVNAFLICFGCIDHEPKGE